MPNPSELLAGLAAIVGPQHLLTDTVLEPFQHDWRGRYAGHALCAVQPADTDEVARVVRFCAAHRLPMLPQGGNTSLCGAATPDDAGRTVIISLTRLDCIREIDVRNLSITVEAGCTLAAVQAAALAAGALFPLSLPSEARCCIGGNLSTNAGGVQVLRYGNTRDLTLGLEVVLPDGAIWPGLRGLRKDNSGYDLKHLFIGAEGTLGIITAATLKLFPLPAEQRTLWLTPPDPAAAIALLNLAQRTLPGELTAFELISDVALSLVLKHDPAARRPTQATRPWMALCEFSAGPDTRLDARIDGFLHAARAAGLLDDALCAENAAQAAALWRLRKGISDAQKAEGFSIKHDVSVPVSAIPAFLERARQALQTAYPGIRIVAFGHAGDGNLHYNLSHPASADDGGKAFLEHQPAINRLVHDQVAALGGSIAAEHGLGQLKREEVRRYKSPVELAAMHAIKQALDPLGLMNPGKVV